MAKRRMFSQQITESDSFLDMPLSAQALYFHLGMSADDDGFVNNPKRIQRVIGANDDDLKLLIAKNFVLAFDSGVVVIKHWKINNAIRSDRYTPTVYEDEKAMLFEKPNKAYTLTDNIIGIPSDNNRLPSGCRRLGKVSIDKNNVVRGNYDFNELLTADEIQTLYATYESAGELIEQVQNEVNARGLLIKVSAFTYIMGYARNKRWQTR